MKFASGFVLGIVLLATPWMAAGDTILLKNGDQAIGTIVSMNEQEVAIDINGNIVRLLRSDIAEIIRKEESSGTTPPAIVPATVQPATEIQTQTQMTPLTPLTPVVPFSSTLVPSSTQVVSESAPQPLLPVVLPKGKAYWVIGIAGRFRKGPSLDYEIVESLPGQTILLEIEFVDNWLHAKTLAGVEGWIHPSSVQALENQPCLVTGDRLHVREAADELSRSLERLRKGDAVLKLQERGDWWFILSTTGVAGWSSKQYLSPLMDKNSYSPPMRMVGNADLGMPILVDRKPMEPGVQQVTFILRDENIAVSGKTRLIVFFSDPNLFTSGNLKYVSESIIQRDRLDNALTILQAGLPEQAAVSYIGADLLTVLGERIAEGWKYTISLPDSPAIAFGFVYQEGPIRGTLAIIQ